jgi:hypothetical protein
VTPAGLLVSPERRVQEDRDHPAGERSLDNAKFHTHRNEPTLKELIIKWMARFHYPQITFAESIKRHLPKKKRFYPDRCSLRKR